GCVLSVRWAWLWLGFIWFLGIITGGLDPPAVAVLVGGWVVYGVIAAGLRLWFSRTCRTTLRATRWTIPTPLARRAGRRGGTVGCLRLGFVRVPGRVMEYLFKLESSQTPPAVFAWLAWRNRDLHDRLLVEMILFSLFGVGSWAVGAFVLGSALGRRFRKATN